ncbi:hypothetical protein CAEBREN_28553 [Caenorhabditis brenneri]|uniref:Uncharacterized protein n=1 Tax=Caenorhabditis brenneri TaxID=135651 RepID=G0NJQ1_CAEBE|nr:hypothetical protein CAEBREN_28553 [Caenorhabditis brenneri]
MMRRSQTVEGSTDSEGGGTTPTKSSRKERWSFAIKRRWFSSSTSRHSHDQDVAIVQPTKTALGGSGNSNADSGSVPDRPDDSNVSGSAVSKRKSLR